MTAPTRPGRPFQPKPDGPMAQHNLKWPEAMRDAARAQADARGVSLNVWIRELVERALGEA